MKTAASLLVLALAFAGVARAAEEPQLAEVVDFSKLIPILAEAPAGWSADKAEGSTDDIGGTKITSVHRDNKKGEDYTAPTTSISNLDSAANPDYVAFTTTAWSLR